MERTIEGNGIRIAYETFGDQRHPPVLLIMGLGTQMLGWDEDFCECLAERGHFVVRFDNRDAGLSTHFHDAPRPNLFAAMGGDATTAVYTLDDMADDTVALMDALGLASAHLVGASMGGMVAQVVAVRHPARVRSLVSIMSTTGERAVSQPTPAAVQALLRPRAGSRDEVVEGAVEAFKVIGSPGFAFDEVAFRERVGRSYDRAYDPDGFVRQLVAVYASGDRTARLRAIGVPTLVVHGDSDPLIPPGAGRATAAAIPGAELMLVEGMGHDLPREVWPRLLEGIAGLVRRGEARAAEASAA